MAQPYTAQAVAGITAIQNAMSETWDPYYAETSYRLGDITKFFRPINRPWPKGKKLHVVVESDLLSSTRAVGDLAAISSNSGTALPAPANTIGFAEWQIDQADLMGFDCPVRYEWKTGQLLSDDIIGNVAEKLSRESMADMMHRVELAIINRQSGVMAQVTNPQRALAAAYTTAFSTSTDIRVWLKYGSAAQFNQGDVLELRTASGSNPSDCVDNDMSSTASTAAGQYTVKNVGYAYGASLVYGYLDLAGTRQRRSSSVSTNGATWYILRSGEYDSTYKPGSAPSTASTGVCPYGLRDWFIGENNTPGTLYNINRTTLGNQWACPIVRKKASAGSETVWALSDFDAILMELAHKHLNVPALTNLALLAGPNTVAKFIALTSSANRRVDSSAVNQQSIVTNYGFDGILVHSPFLAQPLAIQPVRGMAEDVVYIVQPGVLNLISLGNPDWLPYDSNGAVWHGEGKYDSTTSAVQRTTVFRADRIMNYNTLIKVPRFCGAITGGKPE